MGNVTKQQVHIDGPLTNITIAAMQSASDFVASQLLPVVPVSKQSDRYFKYNSGDFARDQAKRRAAGTESAGTGFELTNDSYLCEKYALHVDFDYDVLNNADDGLQLENAAAELLSLSMLIRKEQLFADACWTTTAWTTSIAGDSTTQWSNYVSSEPIAAIDTAKQSVRQKIGKDPNVLILGEDVFLKLKEHPDLVGRIQYTSNASNAIITEQAMAQLLGVEKIHVARAMKNTASEGLAASMSAILNAKHALLCYIPKSVGLMTQAAFVEFGWTGGIDQPRAGKAITRRFDLGPAIGARRIETEIASDIKVTSADSGYYFASIVA